MIPGHVNVSFCYMTCRREPMFHWFSDSLHRELGGNYKNTKLIIIDFFADEQGRHDYFREKAHSDFLHKPPKPTVWQGPHKLTQNHYFAAANARNTAICYAPDGWIVFVDDLSVLLPGWIDGVIDAMSEGYVVLGAYKKVKNLIVDGGNITSFEPFPPGVDSRIKSGARRPVTAAGSWLFGCSFGAPISALLEVNGLDEDADSTGVAGEDYLLGIRLQHRGWKFKYDLRMMTYESEELHHTPSGITGKRMDKGVSPNDKSHAILATALKTPVAPNYFGHGGIAELRQKVLAGEAFPIPTAPTHDWYDQQPLSEL